MLSLPTHIEHNGVEYPINTHYSVALECFELINSDVSDTERAIGVVTLLFGVDIPVDEKSIDKASIYLEAGNEGDDNETQTVDFNQHAEYIYASFKEQYANIDFETLHFWEFISLFKGLNPKTVMGRIQELLTTDVNEIEDAKQRRELVKAQNKFKVKTPEDIEQLKEQQEKEDYFMNLLNRKSGDD